MLSSEEKAKLLVQAANLLLADNTQDINKLKTAQKQIIESQVSIDSAREALNRAAKALDMAKPFIEKAPQNQVNNLRVFTQQWYSEIESKLGNLSKSLLDVTSQLGQILMTEEGKPAEVPPSFETKEPTE